MQGMFQFQIFINFVALLISVNRYNLTSYNSLSCERYSNIHVLTELFILFTDKYPENDKMFYFKIRN